MSHEKILLGVLQANGLLPAESSDGMYLELLTGGFWNRVYRLRSKQLSTLDWVVKQFADVPANPMFPILPTAEYAALQFLKGHQCAPTPLAFIADSPVGSLSMSMSREAIGMVTLKRQQLCLGECTASPLILSPQMPFASYQVMHPTC